MPIGENNPVRIASIGNTHQLSPERLFFISFHPSQLYLKITIAFVTMIIFTVSTYTP